MSAWVETSLNSVAQIQYGKSMPWDKRRDGPYPVYGSAGLVGSHDTPWASGPAIIIGRKGTIGTVYFSKTPFWPIDTTFYINKVDTTRCLITYLYHVLRTLRLPTLDEDTAVPGLNRETLGERRFKLPPLEEQAEITRALDAFDEKIALLREQNDTITALADAYFEHLFIDDQEDDPRQLHIASFGKIISGFTPPTDNKDNFVGEILFIKIPDMRGNPFVLESRNVISEEALRVCKKELPLGAVLVSCIATVGLVSITAKRGMANQQVYAIVPSDPRHRIFLFCFFRCIEEELKNSFSRGTTIVNLTVTDFATIQAPYPDEEKLDIFHRDLEPLFERVLDNQKQIIALRDMQRLLAPRLVSQAISLSPSPQAPHAPKPAAAKDPAPRPKNDPGDDSKPLAASRAGSLAAFPQAEEFLDADSPEADSQAKDSLDAAYLAVDSQAKVFFDSDSLKTHRLAANFSKEVSLGGDSADVDSRAANFPEEVSRDGYSADVDSGAANSSNMDSQGPGSPSSDSPSQPTPNPAIPDPAPLNFKDQPLSLEAQATVFQPEEKRVKPESLPPLKPSLFELNPAAPAILSPEQASRFSELAEPSPLDPTQAGQNPAIQRPSERKPTKKLEAVRPAKPRLPGL